MARAQLKVDNCNPERQIVRPAKRPVQQTPEPTMKTQALWLSALLFTLCFLPTDRVRAAAEESPTKTAHKNVNPDEFEKLSKEPDTVILDVRSPQEYARGHIKNSVLINFNDKNFDEKIKQLDKGKTYLVHCAVGGRSAKACDKLDTYGFPKVVNLEGGIKAWEKAGKPVEK
jgi:rhodanese-related sulfurtransferase